MESKIDFMVPGVEPLSHKNTKNHKVIFVPLSVVVPEVSGFVVPSSSLKLVCFLYLQAMTARNKLGLFDFTMIVVSLVIGMGIFRTPANVAAATPTPTIFFVAWIAGGLVALCGALTYAEIGSRLPVMGGYYKVFSYAYHPSIAFAINCIILVSNAASGAAVALVGSEYT